MAIIRKKISNVDLMPAVDGISRKLALRRETCYEQSINKGGEGGGNTQIVIPGHTYMGVTTKDIRIYGYGTAKRVRLFMRKSTPVPKLTDEQGQRRLAFGKGNAWVAAAMKDLTVISANQAKFLAATKDLSKTINGISVAGYQSMRGWMSAIAISLAADNKLPETHALPNFDA